jgi:uncharacterized lipoprotein YajG
MRRLVPLLSLFLAAGCAWTEERVQIPRPAIAASPAPEAAGVGVTVQASDARAEPEVSHKKNGYGMRAANIFLRPITFRQDLESSVMEILEQQGFRPGSDAAVRVTLNRLYNNFDMHFFSATASAQAIATINVTDRDGRSVYSRAYTVDHREPGVQIMSADNAALALSGAYRTLMQQIAGDADLTRALAGAGRSGRSLFPSAGQRFGS